MKVDLIVKGTNYQLSFKIKNYRVAEECFEITNNSS